jgi:hypothetical protein
VGRAAIATPPHTPLTLTTSLRSQRHPARTRLSEPPRPKADTPARTPRRAATSPALPVGARPRRGVSVPARARPAAAAPLSERRSYYHHDHHPIRTHPARCVRRPHTANLARAVQQIRPPVTPSGHSRHYQHDKPPRAVVTPTPSHTLLGFHENLATAAAPAPGSGERAALQPSPQSNRTRVLETHVGRVRPSCQ